MSIMVEEFLDRLWKLVNEEEMTDYAKEVFRTEIKEFEKRWQERTSPDYDAMIKERDEHIQLLQDQIHHLDEINNELWHEKQEVVKQYEDRLRFEKSKINQIIESNAELSQRIQLAEELNFNLMETFLAYKKRREKEY